MRLPVIHFYFFMSDFVSTVLLEDLADAHQYMKQTMEGVTADVASFQPEGTANPIAGTYAHLVFSEDFFTHMLLQGKQPLFATEWKDKTGASEVQPDDWVNEYPKWLRRVTIDVEEFAKYADAVAAASEAYVKGADEAELSRELDMSAFGMGKRPVHKVVTGMVIGHIWSIMGEVSVLKGIQGLKGYPF